jgi:proline iminopeptidase
MDRLLEYRNRAGALEHADQMSSFVRGTGGLSRRALLGRGLLAGAASVALRGAAVRAEEPGASVSASAAAEPPDGAAGDGSHALTVGDPSGAGPPRAASVRTGGARMLRVAGEHRVWVKAVGLRAERVPVLTLHGGPGLTHFYFECFEDFLPPAGIGYFYYDQLGCGFSDQPKDTALWRIERYIDVVEDVRGGLGLEKMVILGHSWGGMLAIEYALQHPERVAALVISNMTASISSYLAYIAKLRAELPVDEQRRLRELEAARRYDAPEYEKIVFDGLYRKHICRLNPWPEPVDRAVKWLSNPVYQTMQGASEFEVTGVMKGWDRWGDIHRIRCPTLILGGRHDTMNPEDLRGMGRRMPDASTYICDQGSHLAMYDDQQAYFAALVPFLASVTRA